jgi:hypothetical protein
MALADSELVLAAGVNAVASPTVKLGLGISNAKFADIVFVRECGMARHQRPFPSAFLYGTH